MGGFSTVAPPIWTPKFERYADVSVPGRASYTPASPGIYSGVSSSSVSNIILFEIYSDALGAWYPWGVGHMYGGYGNAVPVQISDGQNARYRNTATIAHQLVLMRMG
jgi:hypothetical protein